MYVGLKTASSDNKLFLRLFYHLNIVTKAGKHYSSVQGDGMKVVCLVWGGMGWGVTGGLATGQRSAPSP